MKKIDKRVQRNTKSILALHKLLQEIIQEFTLFSNDTQLHQALKSQGSLANYANSERGIIPMSLNTAKRISEHHFEQGFISLDKLRIAAKDAITEKKQKSDKTTKLGLLKCVSELELENQLLKEELLLISSLLQQSMQQAQTYAGRSNIQSLVQLMQKEQCELRAKLSLRHSKPRLKLVEEPYD